MTAAALVMAGALLCPQAQAQGYEVRPWPSHQAVPALRGVDLQGKTWQLADLKGRAVLVNFWATWCEPCLAEMPSLQALDKLHGSGELLVLTVNFKESATTAQRFAQRTDMDLPVLTDPNGEVAKAWGVRVFPSTALIASNGKVQGVVRGALDWTGPAAQKLIAPLLAQR